MKQLICKQPGEFEYREVPEPVCPEGHSLLRVNFVGVCGTDIHAFAGRQPYFSYPRVLGHELSCTFLQGSPSNGFQAGDAVTVIPYIHCGQCYACRRGATNCCASLKVMGVHTDGGMQEYIVVPDHLILPGEGIASRGLALTEPLAIGAHGVRRAGIQPGDFVLVCGAGPIGLGTMAFAKQAGGHVIALDTNAHRLAYCREQLHIPYTIDAGHDNVKEALEEITQGDMPGVVIDATGNLKAMETAFTYLAHSGRYVLIGLQRADIRFSHPEFHQREATLMSSRNATKQDFVSVMDYLRDGHFDCNSFITSQLDFAEVATSFSQVTANPENIKTIITLP